MTSAQTTYNRYSRICKAIQSIRNRIAHEPLEHQDLRRFGELGILPDFDIVQVSWKADYESLLFCRPAREAASCFHFAKNTSLSWNTRLLLSSLGKGTLRTSSPSPIISDIGSLLQNTERRH